VIEWKHYERTCGTEDAAKRLVGELGPRATYTVCATIRGAFYRGST
jgi:hypothetical protein